MINIRIKKILDKIRLKNFLIIKEKYRNLKWSQGLLNRPNLSNKITSKSNPKLISKKFPKLIDKWKKSDHKMLFKIKPTIKALLEAEKQREIDLLYIEFINLK